MASLDDDHEDYTVPLHHKRPFGAGLKRKAVPFVRASSPELSTVGAAAASTAGTSVGDLYLSLVLPKDSSSAPKPAEETTAAQTQICTVCNLPMGQEAVVAGELSEASRKHEASIAHQVCLTHSYPPSAIDRSRKGLAYLESYGWDPDSRQGLGSAGQGIQYPLKVKPKDDKLGLGVVIPKEIKDRVAKKKKPEKMDAKQCRKAAADDKKRAEQLRRQFYCSEDLERYLGPGT